MGSVRSRYNRHRRLFIRGKSSGIQAKFRIDSLIQIFGQRHSGSLFYDISKQHKTKIAVPALFTGHTQKRVISCKAASFNSVVRHVIGRVPLQQSTALTCVKEDDGL